MSDDTDSTDRKLFSWEYPGHINLAHSRNGYHSGCLCVGFDNIEAMNEYFKEHKALLVVDTQFAKDGKVVVWYTRQLDPEQQQEFEMWSREWDAHWLKRKDELMEARRKAKEAEDAAIVEQARLASVGRKCEHDKHIEQIRNLHAKKGGGK